MTIKFTKVSGGPFYINPDYIVSIDPTPFGTHVVLTSGDVLLKDTEDDVVSKLASSGINTKTLTYTNNYERI